MKCLFSLLLCFNGLFIAWSQPQLGGTVLDAVDGSVLIGAHVMPLADWSKGAITDVNGSFEIVAGPGDSLLISFVGYREKQIVVPGDYKDSLIIELEAYATEIEGLTIVSERLIAEEFTVKKLNRLDIYKNPNAKADALLAVNGLPSVTTLDESANISFRGSGPGETGIFLNQVPVYDAVRFSQLNGIGTFSIFNTELVNSVNVFPGNPPLEYGNTTSGLISIQTRDEVQFSQTQINISMANLGFFKALDWGQEHPASFIAFGNFQPSFALKSVNSEALSDISSFKSLDGGIQWTQQLGDNQKLKLFNYTLAEGYDFNYVSPSFAGIFLQRKFRNFSIINYSYQFENSVLRINGGYNHSNTDLDYSQFDYDIAQEDAYFSLNYHHEKHRLEWKTGMAADYRLRNFKAIVPELDYALAQDHPSIEVQNNQDRLVWDGYVFTKYRPSKKISFGYALRANLPVTTDEIKLGRQSVIQYSPAEQHRLIFSRGTYHRYDWLSNQAIGWISSKQVAVDYQLEKSDWQWMLSGYSKQVTLPSSSQDILGLETYFRYQPTHKFFWDMSYGWIDVEEKQGSQIKSGIYDLNYFVRSGVEWNFSTYWTLASRMLWRQGAYYTPLEGSIYRSELDVFEPTYISPFINQMRLPDYRIVDLNVSRLFTLTEDIQGVLFGSVSNVMDRNNIRSYTYDAGYEQRINQYLSRRVFYFGVVFTFQ